MSNKKVILSIKGGLGNQIFQIIAAVNFCNLNKIDSLNIYTPNLSSYKAIRTFDIDICSFNLNCKVIRLDKKNIFLSKPFILLYKKINFLLIKIIDESNLYFPTNSKINIIDGYFQSSKFLFTGFAFNLFKAEFEKKYINSAKFAKRFLSIDFDTDFALHIRGTDFINHKELINNNPKDLIHELNLERLYIFTDDRAYSSELLKSVGLELVFISDFKFSDFEEFILMAKFRHFIITNSTFSLTASLLNSDSKRQIWSPRNWYYSNKLNNELTEIINYANFKLY
jgi:hypothetical protein